MPDPQDDVLIDKWDTGDTLASTPRPRLSAVQALSQAWDDTLEFLFKPLDIVLRRLQLEPRFLIG
jgi:hypothetical protein